MGLMKRAGVQGGQGMLDQLPAPLSVPVLQTGQRHNNKRKTLKIGRSFCWSRRRTCRTGAPAQSGSISPAGTEPTIGTPQA